MDGNKIVKRIARIAIFSSLLIIQKLLLSEVPNVQFTQLLIVVYFYAFGYKDDIYIILIYILVDNIIFGSFNIVYTPLMVAGWLLLPTILLLFKRTSNRLVVAFITLIHAFIYSWLYAFGSVIMYKVPFSVYVLADIPWEITLALVGFVSVFFLKNKLVDVLSKIK